MELIFAIVKFQFYHNTGRKVARIAPNVTRWVALAIGQGFEANAEGVKVQKQLPYSYAD